MATKSDLSLDVRFEQEPQLEIPLMGFLFHCSGLLLQRSMVKEGRLEFNLQRAETEPLRQTGFDTSELRVFITPVSGKKLEQVSVLDELEAYKPYEAVLNSDRQGNITILPIPSFITQFWPVCNCRVTGKISKWFRKGNTWEDRAVCRARVHICEVDRIRYWIEKIPDTVIARIPELILKPKEVIRWPIPEPDPGPFRPGIFHAVQPKLFGTRSAEQAEMNAVANLPELGPDIRQKIASGNLGQIRDIIVENYAILHPWFCLWPWLWPWLYRCDEKKVVYTDANGRFDTLISYSCFGDRPDIYIWIEYYIDGAWTVVYHPPVPCNTRWNYVCGSDIHIHITDPRVPGNCCCNCPLPGSLVWIRTIGHTSVSRIYQRADRNLPPPGQTVPYNRIGLTDAPAANDAFFETVPEDYKRPFGGTLRFYMGFGDSLPNDEYYYYRWSYRKVAAADLTPVSGTLEQVDNTERKSYDFLFIDANGDEQIGHNSVKLGPETAGPNDNLYIIPPANPVNAPFNVPENSPMWFERTRNTHTMEIDSSALKNGGGQGGDGLYEFTLELFDKNGNKKVAVPKSMFKVPTKADQDISENAADELLISPDAATAAGFKMLVRIDNSACDAEIYTVNVNGEPASTDCCGFVQYKPGGVEADLQLSFTAYHPNNFAVFSFGVNKGTCGSVANAGAGGMVIDSVSGYTLSSGRYEKHFTPQQLLESCYQNGTGKAAFAETLAVIAIATDGTSRLGGKDAYEVAAFALEP